MVAGNDDGEDRLVDSQFVRKEERGGSALQIMVTEDTDICSTFNRWLSIKAGISSATHSCRWHEGSSQTSVGPLADICHERRCGFVSAGLTVRLISDGTTSRTLGACSAWAAAREHEP